MTNADESVKLAVSLWHEITGTVLGNDTSERIKHFLNSRRDDDLAYSQCACAFSTLHRSPNNVAVVTVLTAVGLDGLGAYLRDSPFAHTNATDAVPNTPAIYFCCGCGDGADIRFVVVDLCPIATERYAISRRENETVVRDLLVKASQGRGQYWLGGEEVANEVVTAFDESQVSFSSELIERIIADSVGFLQNLGMEQYKALGVSPKRGLLLYGVPGAGKTVICKIVAKRALEHGINVVHFDSSTVRYLSYNFSYALRQAMKRSPVIIIFDDIDLLCSPREGEGRKNPFLADMLGALDGIETSAGYVVLGATNHLDRLDSALVRAGRFDIHIPLAKPTATDIERCLPVIVGLPSIELSTDLLASLDRLTYADLAEIARRYKIDFLNSSSQTYVWDMSAFQRLTHAYIKERGDVNGKKENANKTMESDK